VNSEPVEIVDHSISNQLPSLDLGGSSPPSDEDERLAEADA
jgi:hypothetical protein